MSHPYSFDCDPDHNVMCLNVKFSDNQSFSLPIQPCQTIKDIKELLGSKTGLQSHTINLVFAGQLLDDLKTTEDYDLNGHTTLHAFCRSKDHVESNSQQRGAVTKRESGALAATLSQRDSENISFVSLPEGIEGFSRFFVYCKICKCLRPGLLRVVCKSCGSGIFVVNHGPSCWQDISADTTLKGRCENENCTLDTPRFFFRCSQRHQGETEGQAAALVHVQSNRKRVECIVCQDVCTHVLIFPCPPGHVMCLDCFKLYSLSALSERQFVEHEVHGYTLPCPVKCEDSFIEDSHHFLFMGQEQYERYKNFGAEEFVLKNGGVLCPAPSCGMGIFPDEENDSRLIRCSECNFESCKDCKRAYHLDSCQESLMSDVHNTSNLPVDKERAQRASWECESLSLIGEITKACPGCSTKTEKNGGCMHIDCSRCGTEWCWLCVKPWDRECQAYHWFG